MTAVLSANAGDGVPAAPAAVAPGGGTAGGMARSDSRLELPAAAVRRRVLPAAPPPTTHGKEGPGTAAGAGGRGGKAAGVEARRLCGCPAAAAAGAGRAVVRLGVRAAGPRPPAAAAAATEVTAAHLAFGCLAGRAFSSSLSRPPRLMPSASLSLSASAAAADVAPVDGSSSASSASLPAGSEASLSSIGEAPSDCWDSLRRAACAFLAAAYLAWRAVR